MSFFQRMIRSVTIVLCLVVMGSFLYTGEVHAEELPTQEQIQEQIQEQTEEQGQQEQKEQQEEQQEEPVDPEPVVRVPANIISLTNDSAYASGTKFKTAYLSWSLVGGEADGYEVYIDGKYYKSINDVYPISAAVPIKYKKDQKVKLRAYILDNGVKKYGSFSNSVVCRSQFLGNTSIHVTRISSKTVRIYWTKVAHATGYYVYKDGKYFKTITGGKHDLVYKGKNAPKKSYGVVPFYKDETGVYRSAKKTSKTAASNKWYKAFSPSPKYYGWDCTNHVNINKVYYSKAGSTGRLKAVFTVTNTWKGLRTRKAYITLSVKSQGVVIAKQRFKIKDIKGWSKKVFKVKFKTAKKGYDLTIGGGCTISVKYKYYQ